MVGKGGLCSIGDFGQPIDDPACVGVDGCDGMSTTPDGNDDLKCSFVTFALTTFPDGDKTYASVCFDYDADGDGTTYETHPCVSQEVFLTKVCE